MMDPDTHVAANPSAQAGDSYPSFASDPPVSGQEAAARSGPQGHFAGPYPNSGARGRQRGRFSYGRRGGGHRPSHRGRNHHNHYQQQQHDYEASGDNGNASNRSFNRYFRPTMLEDPWLYLQPQKVPSHGQSLIFDSVNH